MRITFDYQIFSTQAQGGISRYFVELASHLVALGGCDVEILAPVYINTYLHRSGGRFLPPRATYDWLARLAARSSPGVRRREASIRRRLNQRVSRRRLRRWEPDILHETFFETDPLPLTTGRRVLTVQDMIDERLLLADGRTDQAFVDAKHAAIRRADHVICASERTRADLLNLVAIPDARTTVVYHGCRSADEWPPAAPLLVQPPPFILFVGSRDTYKNFDGLLRAYASSPRLRRELALVAFGGGSFTKGERHLAAELGIPDARLLQLEGDDQVLANLYRQARLCVYPSRYEGFGLIPLEAMTFACPVVTTHGGSLEEVVADAAEIVDGANPESIANGLEAAAFDEAARSRLRTAGIHRARLFTWSRCAIETREVYRRLL